MDALRKLFYVHEPRTDRWGRFIVIGVAEDSMICAGDVFTARFNVVRSIEDERRTRQMPRSNRMEIALTVAGINVTPQSFEFDLDILPRGHTGALHLVGEGEEKVMSECFLETSSEEQEGRD